MESKQITLRSQTVQCEYCGEYYSVTYKYCPFCDEAEKQNKSRRAAKTRAKKAPKEAAPKQVEAPVKKKRRPHPEKEEAPRATRPVREERPRKEKLSSAELLARMMGDDEDDMNRPVRKGPISAPKGNHLSDEQKAQRRATREERAAQRKRERDRRAAGHDSEDVVITDLGDEELTQVIGMPAEAEGPQKNEISAEDIVRAAVNSGIAIDMTEGTSGEEAELAMVGEADDIFSELTTVYIDSNGNLVQPESKTVPATEQQPEVEISAENEIPAQEEESEPVEETAPAEPQKPAVPQPTQFTEESEDELSSLLAEIHGLLENSPVPDPNAEKQPEAASEASETPVSHAEKPDETMDQVLAEAAMLLGASGGGHTITEDEEPEQGVAVTEEVQEETEQVSAPEEAQEEPATEMQEVPAEEEIPAAAEEAQEVAEETAEQPEEPVQKAEEAESVPENQEKEPVLGIDPMDYFDKEEEIVPLVKPVRERKPRPDRKKSSSGTGVKINAKQIKVIASAVVVLLALFILFHNIIPSLRHSGEADPAATEMIEDTAETMAFTQTELTMAEAGFSMQLEVVFQPEGSTAALVWSSSDPSVAMVDENGLVTATAPGTTVITAAMANGQSAQCSITCAWDTGEGAAPAAASGPVLSSSNMTLDAEGSTKTLTVDGASGGIKWSSDKPTVATINTDGIVTAVGKGKATITAEVDGQKLKCDVSCVW